MLAGHSKYGQKRNPNSDRIQCTMKSRSLLIPLIALIVSGCNGVVSSTGGSGKAATDTRSVSGFNSVEMSGSGELQIEQTGSESLTISADDNLLQYLTSDVSGGQLRLDMKSGSFSPSTPVVYKLTVKNLKGIALSGSGSINGKALAADSMKIDLSGSGQITTAGSTDHLEVVISGSGNVQGEGFKTKDARVEIDGSGSATVAASEKLDVNINGSGNVEYIGDPMVSTSKHGSGNVNKRP
jgi:putative autotransporter adhesin-like protein